MKRTIFAVLAWVFMAWQAVAGTWYVHAQDGSDSDAGTFDAPAVLERIKAIDDLLNHHTRWTLIGLDNHISNLAIQRIANLHQAAEHFRRV